MGERIRYVPGTFCWVDLLTSDVPAASGFYGTLLGWEAETIPIDDDRCYTMQRIRGKTVASIVPPPPVAETVPPHWNSYVAVDALDETVEGARELGARVLIEPSDVGESGRLAMVADPTGAVVSFWEAGEHIGAQLVNEPGCLCWNDLATTDVDAAAHFYGELLGWTAHFVEGAPYAILTNAGNRNGGLRALTDAEREQGIPSHWLPYFNAGELEPALEEAGTLGGGTLAGPTEMPAGRIAVARDPQGAVFALWEGEVDP